MKRWSIVSIAMVATAALVAPLAAPAHAQPAEAMGKPLPDPSLKDGTIVVRLIAGDRSKPVSGSEVTLSIIQGAGEPTEKRARTDAEGRATFDEVPEQALVKVTAPGLDGETVSSSQFPMPQTGGIRVMISTIKVAGSGGMGPMQGGPGQPPMSPRMMSGQARPEESDSGDTLTVRVSYDDFADPTPPKDLPVLLVAYRWDQHISTQVVKTDAGGRAVFRGLDKRGAVSYFAMTLLPRGNDSDRLISTPVIMPGDVGMRLMLAGEKRSVATTSDDLGTLDPQPKAGTPPGTVDVTLVAAVEPGMPVELVDVTTDQVLAKAVAGDPLPDPDSITPVWGQGGDDATLAVGALQVNVSHGGQASSGATIVLRRRTPEPAAGATPTPPVPPVESAWSATCDDKGVARLSGVPVGEPLDLYVTIDGMALPARTVTLPKAGGRREDVDATWQVRGQASARFTGITGYGPDKAYVVRGTARQQLYVSAPFQLTPTRGAAVTLIVVPRIMLAFSLTSWVDDVYLGVRGTFSVRNASWAPFVAGTQDHPDDLVIPLPKGFSGATVRQDFAEQVGTDPTRGFVIRRPLPPGGVQFIAGFSLKTDHGELTWDMPLPLGSLESGLEVKRDGTNMRIEVPGSNMKAEEASAEGSRYFVLSPITILPNQRMVFKLHDLPQPPAWTRYGKVVAGLLVMIILAGGVVFALYRPKRAVPPEARFDTLLDELAALDQAGGDPARRAELMKELEALYQRGRA